MRMSRIRTKSRSTFIREILLERYQKLQSLIESLSSTFSNNDVLPLIWHSACPDDAN